MALPAILAFIARYGIKKAIKKFGLKAVEKSRDAAKAVDAAGKQAHLERSIGTTADKAVNAAGAVIQGSLAGAGAAGVKRGALDETPRQGALQ